MGQHEKQAKGVPKALIRPLLVKRMSTDYILVCCTCKTRMDSCLASGSGFYGFKVWEDSFQDMRQWLGHGQTFGAHEDHDLRIVSSSTEMPWE